MLVNVDAQVNQLVRDMNRSMTESDRFVQTTEKEPT